ncbi:Phosphotyrosyl phosphatase activator [Amanita muscaria]
MTTYQPPSKAILTSEQLEWFQTSQTRQDILTYIESLNEAVVNVKLNDECDMSPGVIVILKTLDRVEELVKETPAVENSASRFGNPAFRTFYDKISETSPSLHEGLPNFPIEGIPEVSVYFNESWGNRTRIDYGSGMELNFLCWLICLERLGVTSSTDHKALVIRVFWRYIQVMRTIQSTYWLEPAGSHGVWGLDDYHFIPFLLGSAQLRGHKYIKPRAIHDSEVVEEYSKHYMYFACIAFINSIKTASLRWHSPMLDDISAVKTWDKVNQGMIKMYQAEVLNKLPVIQHFLFGTILPYEGPSLPQSPQSPQLSTSESNKDGLSGATNGRFIITANGKEVFVHDEEHGHDHGDDGSHGHASTTGWGDCCGIPVPSAFAAAQEDRDKKLPGQALSGPGIRPVPFD